MALVLAVPAPAPAAGFVRVHSDALWLDGGPFYFVGANLAVMHGAERTQYVETMVHAREDGAMVGRIWALGEGDGTESLDRQGYLFRTGPDGWNEAAFVHLDHVLAAARMVGLRLIVVLSNSWADYGGIPMYLKWLGGAGTTDTFYSDPRAIALYREHVRRVVGRVSTITGRAYRDDPTIVSWELVNESFVATENVPARRRWIEEMAALVHELDPNHLVTIGHLGYRTARERADWAADHAALGIDYCDHHLYPQPDLPIRHIDDIATQIEDRVRLAREVVQKPIVFGEVGFEDDDARTILETRAGLFRRAFEAARSAGAAGILSWVYLPPGIPRQRHLIAWGAGTASSVEVRREMRRAARRSWLGPERDPPLGRPPLAFVPRFQIASAPEVSVAALRAKRDRRTIAFAIPARALSASRWERQGYASVPDPYPAHAWGSDVGHFEWTFAVPPGRPHRIALSATVSSERPGRAAPPGTTSPVVASVDGIRIGEAVAVPDDGRGAVVTFESSDPTLLARLGSGIQRVRLEVPDAPAANGLCVYEPGLEVELRY
ncbi:MAG: hypothetical protein HYY06_32500 [Deltaproteobacteria bacterium]|nr:hypothetical protein [Deltaproteobacteria bacterium]